MEDKYNEVLEYARSIYDKVGSWAEFSNAIFSQYYGKTWNMFETPEQRRDFINTSQYKEIAKMTANLMDRFGVVAGAKPTNNLGLDNIYVNLENNCD